jgi:hypothetical protein
MPDYNTVVHVVAVYVMEHHFHTSMNLYLLQTLQEGVGDRLPSMTKEQIWGMLDLFADQLQEDIRAVGGLNIREAAVYARQARF